MADVARQVTIGPRDAGRRMSFHEFQRAEPLTGQIYELARGVVEVTDVPGRTRAVVLHEIESRLHACKLAHPGRIHFMAGGSAAKVELPEFESERHPDCSVYLSPMPEDDYPWDKWSPDIVVEVMSAGREARERDFVSKRQEYRSPTHSLISIRRAVRPSTQR